MVTSIFVDEGLQGQYTFGLVGGAGSPNTAALCKASATPTNTTVLADVEADPKTYRVVSGGWLFTLDTSTHTLTAWQNVAWTFEPGPGGPTYYEVALFAAPTGKLIYVETLPSPYTVAPAGGTLIFQFVLQYKNCP